MKLTINHLYINDEEGRHIADLSASIKADEEIESIGQRLVTCWNEHDDLVKERDELVTALRLWMHFFGGDHEDAIMTIVEDGSTLTEPQEITARILSKYTKE